MEAFYPSLRGELERAELVAALARMERGRRNAFYSGVRGDGVLVRRAVRHAHAEI